MTLAYQSCVFTRYFEEAEAPRATLFDGLSRPLILLSRNLFTTSNSYGKKSAEMNSIKQWSSAHLYCCSRWHRDRILEHSVIKCQRLVYVCRPALWFSIYFAHGRKNTYRLRVLLATCVYVRGEMISVRDLSIRTLINSVHSLSSHPIH